MQPFLLSYRCKGRSYGKESMEGCLTVFSSWDDISLIAGRDPTP
jgi:hypothetical protein